MSIDHKVREICIAYARVVGIPAFARFLHFFDPKVETLKDLSPGRRMDFAECLACIGNSPIALKIMGARPKW